MHGIRPRQDYESGDEGYQNDGPNAECGSVLGGQRSGKRGDCSVRPWRITARGHLTTAGRDR